MRYLVTPIFSQKLAEADESTVNIVRSALADISRLTREQLQVNSHVAPLMADPGVYVFRKGVVRIFMSFASDTVGDYALLADLAVREEGYAPSGSEKLSATRRNPRFDGTVNPLVNGQINPRINGTINPLINGQINPLINGQINPNINGQINPRINGQINPNINGQINPRFNSSINPSFNWAINPSQNPLASTRYIYDLSLKNVGFVIRVSESFILLFDSSLNWSGYAAYHSMNGYVGFNVDGSWVEHWESNGQGGYNRFNTSNAWTGFMI